MLNNMKIVLAVIVGILIDRFWMKKLIHTYENQIFELRESASSIKRQYNRFYDKWNILVKWIALAEKQQSVGEYLASCGYKKIAIYGFGELGVFLAKDIMCCKQDVELKYILDRTKKGQVWKEIPILYLDGAVEEVDCIVITTVRNFEEVYVNLDEYGIKNIIDLKQIIANL